MKTIKHSINVWFARAVAVAAFGVIPPLASAATVNASYNSATDVPVTASSYTATGNTVNFTLNYPPTTGTELTVVKNTGLGFIVGRFSNLTNGQPVALSYGGGTYYFVANYYGGSGNDLVLVWIKNRAFAWGSNYYGQLGNNTVETNHLLPTAVTTTGVLDGKTVVGLAAQSSHSMALCSDGTVVAWGNNTYGQLGDNTTTDRLAPTAVSTAAGVSALYGKTVLALAAGYLHSVALCSDGTVAAWGCNDHGELGDNTTTQRNAPVAVNTAPGVSALYDKTVVAVAAGTGCSLALCSDGTVVAWGRNYSGQLGDNTTTDRLVPVAVNMASGVSALYGKTVVAIAVGGGHSLALCSDGTVATWGNNWYGQLGDNTTTDRLVPVAVNTASAVSALYGKTVAAIGAGEFHSLALCSDGTVAAWGYNSIGQLGDNTTTNRLAPVAVSTASGVSVLYGKTVVAIAAGEFHSLALCSDGALAAWGYNYDGQLGDNTTTNRQAPVAVNTTPLAPGERFTRVFSCSEAYHTLALVAAPLAPEINVVGNGLSIPDGEATPSVADGTDFGSVSLGGGTVVRTFTIQNTGSAALNLTGTPKVAVSGPQAADFTVTLQPSSPVPSLTGTTACQVTFAPGAEGLRTATLSIANNDSDENLYDFAIQGTGALAASYTTGNEVPLTVNGFTAAGKAMNFTLNYAPAIGTELMVVKNTALGFITGTFSNLTNGQPLALSYNEVTYNFVANYYGGSGNDLVLVWANNRPFAWGYNSYGQLGDNTTTNRLLPAPVTVAGVFAGKTVVAVAAGTFHSLALCSDGTLAACGRNDSGQLGDNTTTNRLLPVAVNRSPGISALYGKTVVAISAGDRHSLALCSDGTVVAWGANSWGQLGDHTYTARSAPMAVNTASAVSALYGKTVVGIAAGGYHSLALCSDGTVVAWGSNGSGELGNNTGGEGASSSLPVAVNTASGVSALYGNTVMTITGGGNHSVALCSNGLVAAWGDNGSGQLGDNTITTRFTPVAVNTAPGVSALYGKTVVAIGAGWNHTLALCLDGTVAAWGWNYYGQLGDNTTAQRNAPVAVTTASGISALYGKTVVAATAGADHNLALCSDGTVAEWGYDGVSPLGDSATTNPPVAVSTAQLSFGERFVRVASGSSADHTLALVAVPPPTRLQAQRGAGTLTLKWPTNLSGFVPQASPALASVSNWADLAGTSAISNGNYSITLTATNATRFFRLRSP